MKTRESKLQEGLNSSAIFFDELHTQANSELWDVLNLGSATRNSPLTVGITTAGYDMDSTLLGSLYKRGRKIESGEEEDDSFCFIWLDALRCTYNPCLYLYPLPQ